ncbi:mannosyl-oligosaccharide alpha-1,2-mannosidase 1B-like protein [Hapsidospora chrysogenum ATCC 11550]|uniref:alpha-1,2-Mannosidase n=1 Tax=Hapsidospora chrysogenum (strain ATCC 11550 / CBS 779.69 / DSM 880 / IAM 14645 / JCM 23072 / IMI 49137) TaxID=857340 RepID=A0A086STN2_HAPC1|nr:mannosyl-oligosaccharide alpha-1,2-mannosidase 1B-like protein [Hapsidospora chrysogenum ATCC 11550]
MRLNSKLSVLLGLAAPGLALPGPSVAFLNDRSPNLARAQAVKSAFRTSWDGYYKHAFPHDSLRPTSNTYTDDRNGWGVTAIDSLSTAIIMRDKDTVNKILDFVPTLDFTTTKKENELVSVFESNIRYLGGLLSGYDLLKGPFKDLASDPSKVDALLKQARTLADSLSIAFDTPSGVPEGDIYLNPEPRRKESGSNSIAGFGTLVLEWTRLSDLTGDDKYAKLAQRGEQHILRPKGSPEAFPGLVGYRVSTETGEFLDSRGAWGGGTDSFYEYLIKMYLYDPEEFGEYKERWVAAVDSTIKYLASHPSTREDLTFVADYDGPNPIYRSGHLNSFVGGNIILGGILLKEQKYIDFGLELAESYFATYLGTPSGIGPESFAWIDSAADEPGEGPPADQAELYEESGFWVRSGAYILRPETMESLYFAYRVTGDSKWQDLAWEGFQTMSELCRAGSGFSGLRNVRDSRGGGHDDFQQSFWLAETLKYLYLIFSEDSPVQVQADKPNEFVYNTEAHPVRVRG